MRFPLLVGSHPGSVSDKQGPTITISEGKWRVITEGVESSRLLLWCSLLKEEAIINDKKPYYLDGPFLASVRYEEVGTEELISAYVERLD